MTLPTVAVLGGTGHQGRGIALRLARRGHRVIVGSRDAARAATIVSEWPTTTGTVTADGYGQRRRGCRYRCAGRAVRRTRCSARRSAVVAPARHTRHRRHRADCVRLGRSNDGRGRRRIGDGAHQGTTARRSPPGRRLQDAAGASPQRARSASGLRRIHLRRFSRGPSRRELRWPPRSKGFAPSTSVHSREHVRSST